MEKVKEIELLKSLKGDTYFAQLFDDKQIDAMCTNIRNDHPIELGLDLFKNSLVAEENAELKKQLADCMKRAKDVASNLISKANEHSDSVLEDFAAYLVGSKECLVLKLRLALPLSEKDRDTLIDLLTK